MYTLHQNFRIDLFHLHLILSLSPRNIFAGYTHISATFAVGQKSFIRLFEGSIKNPEIDSTSAVGQKEKIVCD